MLPQCSKLDTWWDNHHDMGGYVATCYVDWNILHSPLLHLTDLFEKYRSLNQEQVLQFSETQVTNNSMPDREIMEDASKIYYLVQQLLYDDLIFIPQIVHEPWHDRYRVHPGSGRAAALWLAGYERFRTIYTHFNEPEFQPPGIALKIQSSAEFIMAVMNDPYLDSHDYFDFQTYWAFPTEPQDISRTKNMDSVWDYTQINTLMPWQFGRYSEGDSFLSHKGDWRFESWSLWRDLQEPKFSIGDTDFYFDNTGKATSVMRKGVKLLG